MPWLYEAPWVGVSFLVARAGARPPRPVGAHRPPGVAAAGQPAPLRHGRAAHAPGRARRRRAAGHRADQDRRRRRAASPLFGTSVTTSVASYVVLAAAIAALRRRRVLGARRSSAASSRRTAPASWRSLLLVGTVVWSLPDLISGILGQPGFPGTVAAGQRRHDRAAQHRSRRSAAASSPSPAARLRGPRPRRAALQGPPGRRPLVRPHARVGHQLAAARRQLRQPPRDHLGGPALRRPPARGGRRLMTTVAVSPLVTAPPPEPRRPRLLLIGSAFGSVVVRARRAVHARGVPAGARRLPRRRRHRRRARGVRPAPHPGRHGHGHPAHVAGHRVVGGVVAAPRRPPPRLPGGRPHPAVRHRLHQRHRLPVPAAPRCRSPSPGSAGCSTSSPAPTS